MDPAGGSFTIEERTSEIASDASALLDRIEAHASLAKRQAVALRAGLQVGEVEAEQVVPLQDVRVARLDLPGEFPEHGVDVRAPESEGEPERAKPVLTDHECPACGKPMIQIEGRLGPFLRCSDQDCPTKMNIGPDGKPVLSNR